MGHSRQLEARRLQTSRNQCVNLNKRTSAALAEMDQRILKELVQLLLIEVPVDGLVVQGKEEKGDRFEEWII